jgi:hypothetical protein
MYCFILYALIQQTFNFLFVILKKIRYSYTYVIRLNVFLQNKDSLLKQFRCCNIFFFEIFT